MLYCIVLILMFLIRFARNMSYILTCALFVCSSLGKKISYCTREEEEEIEQWTNLHVDIYVVPFIR